MTHAAANFLIRKFQHHMQDKLFIGQEPVLPTRHRYCIAGEMTDHAFDKSILSILQVVSDELNNTTSYHLNAVVLFKGPDILDQEVFDQLFLQRMIALQHLDVSEPAAIHRSGNYYSTGLIVPLRQRLFYVTGLHPTHRLKALRFPFPSLVFDTLPEIAEHTSQLDYLRQQCLS